MMSTASNSLTTLSPFDKQNLENDIQRIPSNNLQRTWEIFEETLKSKNVIILKNDDNDNYTKLMNLCLDQDKLKKGYFEFKNIPNFPVNKKFRFFTLDEHVTGKEIKNQISKFANITAESVNVIYKNRKLDDQKKLTSWGFSGEGYQTYLVVQSKEILDC